MSARDVRQQHKNPHAAHYRRWDKTAMHHQRINQHEAGRHRYAAVPGMLAVLVAAAIGTPVMAQRAPDAGTQALPEMAAAPAAPGSTAQDTPAVSMDDMPGMDMSHDRHAQGDAQRAAVPSRKPQIAAETGQAPARGDQQSDLSTSMTMPMAAPATGLPANDHVAPAPPQHTMPAMGPTQMIGMMQMDDQAAHGMLLFDRLERRRGTAGDMATAWEADGWWGGDIDKLWLSSEGETGSRGTQDARVELLWSHAFSTFWDWRLGARDDFGQSSGRQWAAFGVQGLAPYWFDIDASFYVGPQGRTAARVEARYDLRLTQKLILAPDLELNFYGKDDPRHDQRAGWSDADLGLRLRYEINRRLAPYVGVNWTYRRGSDAAPPPIRREPVHDLSWLVGARFWL